MEYIELTNKEEMKVSDYRIEIKVKNNRILKYMNQMGFNTVASLKKADKRINQAQIGSIINLKESPLNQSMEWKPQVEYLCELLVCHPTDLFTDMQTKALIKNDRYLEIGEKEMMQLSDKSNPENMFLTNKIKEKVADTLDFLNPIEKKVIQMRYGLKPFDKKHTFDEIGAEIDNTKGLKNAYNECGISRERVRQIEAKALRKLRNPKHSDALKIAMQESGRF